MNFGVCTLTVDDSQAKGTYQLIECAYDFDQAITVVNTSGEELGTLTLDASVAIGNDLYTLSQTAGDYSLLVTIEDTPEPTPPPTPGDDKLFLTGDFDGSGRALLARQKDSAVTIYADGAEWGNGLALDPGWQIEGAMQETPVGFLGGEDLLEKG